MADIKSKKEYEQATVKDPTSVTTVRKTLHDRNRELDPTIGPLELSSSFILTPQDHSTYYVFDEDRKLGENSIFDPRDHMHPTDTGVGVLQFQNISNGQGKFLSHNGDSYLKDSYDKSHNGEKKVVKTEVYVKDGDGFHKEYNKEVPMYPFRGALTQVNTFGDPVNEEILKHPSDPTVSRFIYDHDNEDVFNKPITPLTPFARTNEAATDVKNSEGLKSQYAADHILFNSYNRFKIPIVDTEFRKGFRYIFITRPECYLMCTSGTLCDQASKDTDFLTANYRNPHLIKLLSPYYITQPIPYEGNTGKHNWNYFISNKAQGLSVAPTVLSINDKTTHSVEGYTVSTGMNLESRQGSSIDINFTDTKNMEVFEYFRLWMLYIYKRKRGIFAPPFNGYQYNNGFISMQSSENGRVSVKVPAGYPMYHPYDRAIEYCASLYDVITDETGEKILYWCKYYGIFPTSVSPNLSNENNAALTTMTSSVTFKYHYRLENNITSLVEFNNASGIVDELGHLNPGLSLNKSESFIIRDGTDEENPQPYIGAGGMFTGVPYILMEKSLRQDVIESNGKSTIYVPKLHFLSNGNNMVNSYGNMDKLVNINNDVNRSKVVANKAGLDI